MAGNQDASTVLPVSLTRKSQTLLDCNAGFKAQDLKKKEKQNKRMKWKLSLVMPREESLGFPPGDQVSNGHDM